MSKGSEFERQFCDRLSEWWTGEKGRRVFWRSSNSGGMATARNKKGKKTKQHCGDVCAIDPVGFPLTDLITFEIKRGYSRHTIANLLDKPDQAAIQTYEKWVIQAEEACENAGSSYWLLVVKRDQRKPLVFMHSDLASVLESMEGPFDPRLTLDVLSVGLELVGTTLDTFLDLIQPDVFRQLVGERKEVAG